MLTKTATALATVLALSACGAASTPCAGVTVGGMCWVGRDGVTVTGERAERVYAIARRFWEKEYDPAGWTVEFAVAPVTHVDRDTSGREVAHVVDGVDYFGWACKEHRLIVVQPFGGADCIERSVIFHELGHAWGVREGDPRLYGGYALMREAMEGSGWRGCLDADGTAEIGGAP